MKNNFQLNIDSPCSEDFNSFSPTKKGGFCDSCKKEVIDFTKMTSDEIITFLNKKKDVCGRFKQEQLNSNYQVATNRKSFFGFLSGIGMACVAFFTSSNLQAQEIKNQNQTDDNNTTTEGNIEQQYFTVKGVVVDDLGPIPGTNVVLEGSKINTTTGYEGEFIFPEKLKKGDVLLFSFVGMDSKKVVIDGSNTNLIIELKVNMAVCDYLVIGKVAKKGVYSTKQFL